jgi:hypothetical protein
MIENLACAALLIFLAVHVIRNWDEVIERAVQLHAVEVAHTIDLWCEVFDLVMVLANRHQQWLEKVGGLPVEQTDRTAMVVARMRHRLVDVTR